MQYLLLLFSGLVGIVVGCALSILFWMAFYKIKEISNEPVSVSQ
jgi:hypothetical protein